MKPQYWLPVVVFLATSIPTVLLLQALDFGGEFRLWIAIGVGAVATGITSSRLAAREGKE